MAKISNVKLKLEKTNRPEIKATVSFRLTTNDSDHGKRFQYSISLCPSEIKLGDGDIEGGSPPVLYQFKFGNSTKKTFTSQPTGLGPISETRTVASHILAEDPRRPTGPSGEAVPGKADIFAKVSLWRVEGQVSGRIDEKHSGVVHMTIM